MANPESPYGLDRQKEMMFNQDLFEKKVRYFTQKYAAPQLGYKEYNRTRLIKKPLLLH